MSIEDATYQDAMMALARTGISFEKFVQTDEGRYLLGRAEQTRRNALEQLSVVDPEDSNKIRDLQMLAMVPRLFQQWVREAIDEGNVAYQNLKQTEAESGNLD